MKPIFTVVGSTLNEFVENFLQQGEVLILKTRYKGKLGNKYKKGTTTNHEIEIKFDTDKKEVTGIFVRPWPYYEDESKTIDNTDDIPDDFDFEQISLHANTVVELMIKMLKFIDEQFGTGYFEDCWIEIDKEGEDGKYRGELIKGGIKAPT